MTKLAFTATSVAALLLAGSALSATPITGEEPLFNESGKASTLQPQHVRIVAINGMSASDEAIVEPAPAPAPAPESEAPAP